MFVALFAPEARADCASPSGKEGEFFYNVDYKTMQFCDGTDWISMSGGSGSGGSGITDGNKGDVTVSGAGATWTINSASVQYSKIQNVGASTLLGRYDTASGSVQEISLGAGLSLNSSTGVLSASGSLSGSGAAGYVPYWSSATALSYDNATNGQFFWDATNHRLGIGLAAPTQALDVFGKITGNAFIVKPVTGAAIPANGAPTASNFTNMIVAFAATSCPANWTPYVAAYGRFLRGIDPTGATTVDPRGTVAPGTQQADAFQGHRHAQQSGNGGTATGLGGVMAADYNNYSNRVDVPITDGVNGTPRTASETRPVNVAVIFCQYTGTGMGGGASALSGLTDVDTTGLASGKVLTYNGTKWVPGTTSGGSSSGTAGYVQFSGGSGAFASDSTSGGQLFWDSTNHRLGIGTAAPAQKLHVSGVVRFDDDTATSGIGTNGLLVRNNAAQDYLNIWNYAADTFAIESADQTTYRSLVLQPHGGNVGIGTGSPAYGIDVWGASAPPMRLRNTNATSGQYWVVGPDNSNNFVIYNQQGTGQWMSNGGTAWIANSDKRLKERFAPLDDALARITSLKGVTFYWRDKTRNPGRQVGVIAQDVQKVYPELVSSDSKGMLGVNYGGLTAPIIEAVKELKADNDNLRVLIGNQNRMIEAQGRELAALRAKVGGAK